MRIACPTVELPWQRAKMLAGGCDCVTMIKLAQQQLWDGGVVQE